MPKFSTISKMRLSTCDIRLQRVFYTVVKDFDCSIFGGYRGKREQTFAYKHKKSKVKWPNSKHNSMPSMAVDSGPYPGIWPHAGYETYYKDLALWYLFAGYVKGVAYGMGIPLRWGGDWDSDWLIKDQTFDDLPHFELIEV